MALLPYDDRSPMSIGRAVLLYRALRVASLAAQRLAGLPPQRAQRVEGG